MPGSDHFGKLCSSLLTDQRSHRAADLYVAHGIAVADTALATVCGHVAMLGLWAMRETDDGILPGDGLPSIQTSCVTSRVTSRLIASALTDSGLLRHSSSPPGLYVSGFRDCYQGALARRASNRVRQKNFREKRKAQNSSKSTDVACDVTPSNALRNAGVTRLEERRGESPKPPVTGQNEFRYWGDERFSQASPGFREAVAHAANALQPIDRHERSTGAVPCSDLERSAAAFIIALRKHIGARV